MIDSKRVLPVQDFIDKEKLDIISDIEPQLCFALVLVMTVADVTIFREDGPNIAIKLDVGRACTNAG